MDLGIDMDNINCIISLTFHDAIDYIEDMIYEQLECIVNKFKKFYKKAYFKVLINLDDVNVAIPMLVTIILKIREITIDSGGTIEIKSPPKHIEQVLQMSKIDELIEIL